MTIKRWIALALAGCMLSACALAEEQTPTDLPQSRQMPVEDPAEDPADAPSESSGDADTSTETPADAPAGTPSETPGDTPAETPADTPSEASGDTPGDSAWDETLCDHANERCVQAPACDDPACAHIGQDAHGLDIPLCSKGRWLLDRQDALGSGMKAARSVRSVVIDLDQADATIWRSGSYQVRDGGKRSAALTIAPGRLVTLTMTDATLDALTIAEGSQLTLTLEGISSIGGLTLGKGAKLIIRRGGAAAIGAVTADGKEPGSIEISGGSVRMQAEEKNGRRMTAFPAAGATAVTVDGESYPADTPDADGSMYLWLPEAGEGMRWAAAMDGTTLRVIREADVTGPEGILQGRRNELQADTAYTLTGDVAAGTVLAIDQSGVTLVLEDVTCPELLIEASCAFTLYVRGEVELTGLPGSARIINEGRLTLHGGMAQLQVTGGVTVLDSVPGGWTAYAVDVPLDSQTVTLDGSAMPLVTAEGRLLLPTPAEGTAYDIMADGTAVTVATLTGAEKRFVLTRETPDADAGSARLFTVTGGGSYVGGQITAAGAMAEAAFMNVQLQGEESVLRLTDEQLTVTLTGDNALCSTGGQAVQLTGASALTLSVASGRLLLSGQQTLTGITLQGNVKVEPEPEQPHLTLMLRDRSGNPVPNTDMTLMAAGETWQVKTHYDGSVHLWGVELPEGASVAASHGDTVYTAVVVDHRADANPGLSITQVQAEDLPDGSIRVTWQCQGAGSAGVQVLPGQTYMPDTWVEQAERYPAEGGEAVITGVAPGADVTLRVYAASAMGAALTEQSADGFQFSEAITHHHRGPWTPVASSANARYTGRAYSTPLTLPEGAEVTYTGQQLNQDGVPVQVGSYVMHVTIREDNATYLPGVVDVPFAITKVPLTIIPDPNQEKYQGETDPAFTWEVKGLLEGDELSGELLRQQGEEPGNYAFTLEGFDPADYYTLSLKGDAPVFTILPVTSGGMFVGYTFGKLTPVRQEIVRGDGRSVAVTLATRDSLVINNSIIGSVVCDKTTAQPRLFLPSLSYSAEADEVLLRIRCEAEQNPDGGYVTDQDGKLAWGGRTLRLSWLGARRMNQLGVNAVSLMNDGAALTLHLDDLLSQDMQDTVNACGGSLKTVWFRMEALPGAALPDDLQPLQPVTGGWRMGVYMVVDGQDIDVTDLLPSLTASVELETLAALLTDMNQYDEDAFPARFGLGAWQQESAMTLETAFVQPYTESESAASWPRLMDTARYLIAPLQGESILCVTLAD
ncbi:MAG: MBG domain-containing protein [Aristaeellaceae bacterium]